MTEKYACSNCRRPLHWTPPIGWLHGELRQYTHQPITCSRPEPVCQYRMCDHTELGPDVTCPCRCHQPAREAP